MKKFLLGLALLAPATLVYAQESTPPPAPEKTDAELHHEFLREFLLLELLHQDFANEASKASNGPEREKRDEIFLRRQKLHLERLEHLCDQIRVPELHESCQVLQSTAELQTLDGTAVQGSPELITSAGELYFEPAFSALRPNDQEVQALMRREGADALLARQKILEEKKQALLAEKIAALKKAFPEP